jgi:hypothetical protein
MYIYTYRSSAGRVGALDLQSSNYDDEDSDNDLSGALDVTGEGEGFDSDRYKSPYFDRFRDLEWVSVEIQSYLFSVYSRIE